jgi:hypothetical protein
VRVSEYVVSVDAEGASGREACVKLGQEHYFSGSRQARRGRLQKMSSDSEATQLGSPPGSPALCLGTPDGAASSEEATQLHSPGSPCLMEFELGSNESEETVNGLERTGTQDGGEACGEVGEVVAEDATQVMDCEPCSSEDEETGATVESSTVEEGSVAVAEPSTAVKRHKRPPASPEPLAESEDDDSLVTASERPASGGSLTPDAVRLRSMLEELGMGHLARHSAVALARVEDEEDMDICGAAVNWLMEHGNDLDDAAVEGDAGGKWTCKNCTFENQFFDDECGACYTQRKYADATSEVAKSRTERQMDPNAQFRSFSSENTCKQRKKAKTAGKKVVIKKKVQLPTPPRKNEEEKMEKKVAAPLPMPPRKTPKEKKTPLPTVQMQSPTSSKAPHTELATVVTFLSSLAKTNRKPGSIKTLTEKVRRTLSAGSVQPVLNALSNAGRSDINAVLCSHSNGLSLLHHASLQEGIAPLEVLCLLSAVLAPHALDILTTSKEANVKGRLPSERLVKWASWNETAHFGATALHLAVLKGSQDSLAVLLRCTFVGEAVANLRTVCRHGADPLLKNHVGATPLHLAVALEDVAMVHMLLASNGEAALLAGPAGLTPVELAYVAGI